MTKPVVYAKEVRAQYEMLPFPLRDPSGAFFRASLTSRRL